MSVRNIEQGFYDLPVSQIKLAFVGAFSKIIIADLNISAGMISIHIPSFTDIITSTGTLQAGVPTEYTLPTSISTLSYPILVKNNDMIVSTPSILLFNISTGLITICADVSGNPFESGSLIPYGLINDVVITYILN